MLMSLYIHECLFSLRQQKLIKCRVQLVCDSHSYQSEMRENQDTEMNIKSM